jgi:hypothetical protein
MSGAINYRTVTFTASTTSSVLDLGSETLMGITIPAGFTATTLKIQGADKSNGTFADSELVADDMTVTTFQFTCDGTNESRYSFGSSFPPDERYIRFIAGASTTGTVIVRTKGV